MRNHSRNFYSGSVNLNSKTQNNSGKPINKFTPVLVYENADLLKVKIYLENKGKAGIYL